ncbi:hypothetical protein EVAR_84699_1 [Eumeta japonica]|uniref:Uncharacterized protein n=1 Tax=Eumeta variegata TaxID=151549 RepID=A0A4C1VQF6_EUMVA|nr:hypothetical protein EVAR_84699_1 [Eumeta japonica]
MIVNSSQPSLGRQRQEKMLYVVNLKYIAQFRLRLKCLGCGLRANIYRDSLTLSRYILGVYNGRCQWNGDNAGTDGLMCPPRSAASDYESGRNSSNHRGQE